MIGEDELAGASELHAGKRRLLIILGGNALLLIVMLGLPWLRGYLRTRELWRAFGSYGACLFGGKLADQPGLGLPIGHEAAFATRAIREPGFAARCDDELAALAPPEATFIMPAIKVAESDLRAAVALVRTELAPLSALTAGTRLSVRPLRAFERLRAGLANHTHAAGAVAVPEGEAFVLDPQAPTLPTPTRLPLYAGVNALLSMWGSDVELTTLATDQTGVSYVHVRGGQLEQSRSPRPKLLEGALPPQQPTSFVWAMSRTRCAARADACATKTTGIASITLPLATLPTPRWLGAHPRGRIDRSVWRAGDRIVMAAQTGHGESSVSELREFTLSAEVEAATVVDTPPLAPARVWNHKLAGEPLLLTLQQQPVLLSAIGAEHEVQLHEQLPDATRMLAQLAGEGRPWVVGCGDTQALRIAFGHEHQLVMAERGPDGTFTQHEPVSLELRDVVHERDPARDRVLPVCGLAGRNVSVVLDRRDRLLLVSCRDGEPRCQVDAIAASVRSFAVLARGERLIAAYAGDGEASQVRVRSIPIATPDRADEQVPAVCWSDQRGLCGAPTLARLGERAILGAREGTDMRVLESADEGQTWRPLKGLGKRD
jgi:hypothetical protein